MRQSRLIDRLGSTLGARLVMAAVNFGLFWALSHQFDMTSLGSYSLLMNLFYMSMGLPLLGLVVPLERRAAASPETLASEVSNALVIALPMGGLLCMALGLYGWLGHERDVWLPFWLLGAAVWVSAGVLVAEVVLLGREQMSFIARAQCVEAILRTALSLVAVHLGAGLAGVMAVFLCMRIAIWWVYSRSPRLPRPRLNLLDRGLFRRNVSEMPVFFGIATLAGVVARLDLLVLEHVAGKTQVAIYTVAARLYEASLMVPTAVAMVLLPALARLFAADERRFSMSLVVMLQGVLWIGMPVVLGVAALAEPLIRLLYPDTYLPAAAILRWLMLAGLLTAVDQVLSSAMMASHSQVADLKSMVVSVVALALGFVVLIPLLGPLGVAIAVAAALVARLAWRLRWVRQRLGRVGLARELAKALGSGLAGVTGLLLGLAHSPWLALVLGWAALAVGAALSGHLSRHPVQDFARWRQRWSTGGLD